MIDDGTTRTVVLGFDALDWGYLDRYSDALPNFERLREAGVASPLESTIPPWTGSAWPSMYTGTDPSHHGVFGFFRHADYPDEGDVVSRADVDAPALWNYCSSVGDPSIVCNVPVTHPAESIDGVLVPGYLASEDAPGSPEGVRNRLSDAIGEAYRIYSRGELSSDPEEKLAGYVDLIDLRRRAALAMLDDHDWRLAIFQVQKTDAVFHNFEDDEAFRAVYEAADAFLGSVLDAVDDGTNVVVCSDHGIGPVEGYRIHLNEVLREHGYVEATDDADQVTLPSEKRGLVDGQRTGGQAGSAADSGDPQAGKAGSSADVALLPRLVEVLSRVGVTPARVYAVAERLGVEETLVAHTPAAVSDAVAETVDWRASTAYCRKETRLGVRINLEGREPHGVVPAEEYEAVQSELVALLSGLETPDGAPAFETVATRQDLFDGPHADRAPDVITVPSGMDHSLSTQLYGTSFVPVSKHDHKRHGVFLGAGPGFDSARAAAASGADGDPLHLTDVAPIVMALLGQSVPERMTGRVPEGLLSVPVERESYGDVPHAARDGAQLDAPTARDDGAVTDRLEDLGYL